MLCESCGMDFFVLDGDICSKCEEDEYYTPGLSYVTGLVCPECSECEMIDNNSIDEELLNFQEEKVRNEVKNKRASYDLSISKPFLRSIWHQPEGLIKYERHWIFHCTKCMKDFSMGYIYDKPFKKSEVNHGLPELFLRNKEEVIEEILSQEHRHLHHYLKENKADRFIFYTNSDCRNYIKANRWWEDIESWLNCERGALDDEVLNNGVSYDISRKLSISRYYDRNSSITEFRGDGLEEWKNYTNLSLSKISKICGLSHSKAERVFNSLETVRIKEARWWRYRVFSKGNITRWAYEPELFTPSPIKKIDINKVKQLDAFNELSKKEKRDDYGLVSGRKSKKMNFNEMKRIMEKFGDLDIFTESVSKKDLDCDKGLLVTDPEFIRNNDRDWRKTGPYSRDAFSEKARIWYEKYHLNREIPSVYISSI